MKADELMSWDSRDLAELLADKYSDAEVLVEAFPEIGQADAFDCDMLPDFIEDAWEFILAQLPLFDLELWLEEEDYDEAIDEMWRQWRAEREEDLYELEQLRLEEYCHSVIEAADMFRNKDLSGRHCLRPKFRN